MNQWLLQHVKLYEKNTQRILSEDVSGDCLVCFEKQDFTDLDVKPGPTVKILAELKHLKDKPEPHLQPAVSPNKTAEDACHGPNVLQEDNPTSLKNSEQKTNTISEKVQEAPKNKQEKKQASAPPKEETPQATKKTGLKDTNPTIIYEVLKGLQTKELKKFSFYLEGYTESKYAPIPRSKLENADLEDICRLINDNYPEEAPTVTVKILRKIYRNDLASKLEKNTGQLQPKGLLSKAKTEANQGDKLKSLLTCGGNSLDNYDKFVVVINKSRPEQVQYLQFLSKLKLFCVLDFDPKSICPGGVCHSYRELRVANMHSPLQYQGVSETIIKKLNLHKQTSWVFCNGRGDLDEESHKELDYKTWLKTSCRDVEQLVSFICKPEVLYHGRFLIIFILLSPVATEKDPVFDTYRCFYKNTSEKNIITVCDSQSTYLKWKELITEKCDTDIEPYSVNELSLSEINGTIMALGPFSQSSGKLLPSSDSSFIVLKQKDEDLLTALEVLSVNQCENIHDESSKEFHEFKLKQEEEFYRGGKVKWWNFYFCDKDRKSPFIKRDKYENVRKMIRSLVKDSKNPCVLLNLFHDPGCGATTLAMHVMWDLRKELRCAVLKDNTVSKEEVANQVIKLMKLENEKPCTVLLLVDDSKETDSSYELENCIHKTMFNILDNSYPCKVIVLNCVRSHSPKEQYREHSTTQSQYITAPLSPQEQQDFETKLKELEKAHAKPENFYSFMIMKSNFDPKYTRKLAYDTLENFDIGTVKGKLFAFLALLNNFVADSEISLSLCEDFLGIKMIQWQEDGVLNRMTPYSKFLIIERAEDWGGYRGVRILHYRIAKACLEELEERYNLKVSDITLEILHCDLFYSAGVVKNRLMMFIERMLIERQRKKDSSEREPFSPLVEKIHKQQGRQTVEDIFGKASSRFEASASIPQALARYLYINERDFSKALKWAQKARNIAENPFTFDTIAQVYKSNLKYNMNREKQEKSSNPEDLNNNLKIAQNAFSAFERAQELAKTKGEPEEEPEDDLDNPNKSYTVYGYVGVVEIAFLVFEVLGRLPFFDESQDPMNKKYLKSFLEKKIPISSVHMERNEVNEPYVEVIRENERFLLKLKNEVKETFEILEYFFTYFKVNNSEFDSKNRWNVSAHFKKYVTLFCTEPEQVKRERQSNPQLTLKIEIEQRRLFLEEKNADTFTGILQNLDKRDKEISEEITKSYAFLHKHIQFSSKIQATKETTNYILSNIVLHLLKPDSKHLQKYSVLSDLLRKTLQDIGLRSNFPDPYYTALLLFWPNPLDKATEINTFVTAIRHSSRRHLSAYFRSRSTVAHFYLGKGVGLKRLISKLQLDNNFKKLSRDSLAQLWRSGDIFKEKVIKDRLLRVSGTVEQGEVYANYGSQKIPVHPALYLRTRSGFSIEKVSFYLGFAINGPLAYDIQN